MFTPKALTQFAPPTPTGPRSSDDFPAFTPWLKAVSPELRWDYPHLVYLRRKLADVSLGRCNQLIINIPSQFGKSQLITIRYAVWRLMRDPTLRIAVTAHSQKLANKFSRAARRLAVEQGLALGDVQMADEWETAAGGSFIAKGRGAGIVGQPVDLLIIDDPYRDARDAASPTIRETVWEWWTDALSKRLSARGQVICVHTRWRTDDLTGRFLQQGGWEHVALTALAEAGDPLGRADGESLCEALHPRTQLEQQRKENPRSFAGLGQQRPIDQEGNLFKPERIAVQAALPANLTRVVRFFDLAATKDKVGADPDWTVGAKMGRDADGRCFVLDLVRGRFSPLEVKQAIVNTAAMDGKGVPVFVEQEGGASGVYAVDDLVRALAGYPARGVRPNGPKALRAEPFASYVEAGNVVFLAAPWNAAAKAELLGFPTGQFDDVVDAMSGAFEQLFGGQQPITEVVIGGRVVSCG